jgi:hypothetical protein
MEYGMTGMGASGSVGVVHVALHVRNGETDNSENNNSNVVAVTIRTSNNRYNIHTGSTH